MTARTSGLHHVTAIAGDPQRNIDFYIQGLGLRLVKRTVNFDNPSIYHLYHGDESGRPGTLLTFFPLRGVPDGRVGAGQATSTAFSVPQHSLGWWQGHFTALGVEPTIVSVEGEDRVVVRDPDGLVLELVASATEDPREPWTPRPFLPSMRCGASTPRCSPWPTPTARFGCSPTTGGCRWCPRPAAAAGWLPVRVGRGGSSISSPTRAPGAAWSRAAPCTTSRSACPTGQPRRSGARNFSIAGTV